MNIRDKAFRILGLLVLVLTVLTACSGLLYFSFERVRDQQRWVTHTNEVLFRLEQTVLALVNMETGQRGFLLTHQDRFLEPYRRGSVELNAHLEHLDRLVADNPTQKTELGILKEEISKRRVFLDQLLEAGRDRRFDFARREKELSEGRALMEMVRAQALKMEDTERALLRERVEKAARSQTLFYFALAASMIISVLAVSFAFRQFWKNNERMEAESRERAATARLRDGLNVAAKSVAGDLSLEETVANVRKFLTEQAGVLAARFFAFRGGRLEPIRLSGDGDPAENHPRARSLIDESLTRGGLWIVDDVPDDYWKISSELGGARPRQLAFLQLSFQGRRLGVIELATFQPIGAEARELLEKSAEVIAIGVNAAQARDELQDLLEKTQSQAEELEAQQEELRSSNEELEQQARALESQQQAMNIKNRELESTRMDLEAKAQELMRSSQYKSDFLAKMSHELRTPLNGLMILSTLLIENKEKNLTDQQKQFARSIHSAGNDLLLLINDILDLSKIEARKLTMRPEKFNFGTMIEQMRLAFEPQAKSKNLDLQIAVPKEATGLELFTDRLRLEQVLRNFLSNAIKFTDKGFVRIEAVLKRAGSLVEISVTDTGIGIAPEKREAVFEAFEQADGSVGRRFGGTGLGLTIARELAALLGGEVKLESELGKGSRFTLAIPVTLEGAMIDATPHVQTVAAKERAETEATSKAGTLGREAEKALRDLKKGGRSIMIVEDDLKFQESVVEAAKQYGFQPVVADSGELALAILEKHTPDAILLDIKLPGISGMGLLEMIKHLPHLRHIPVHMISALDYQHNALRMGALGYLTKPVTMDKVRAALERVENMLSNRVRHILLVEDDQTQALGIEQLVSGDDVKVTTSSSGRDAISKLKEVGFDCIVVDLNLPDMSGVELLDEFNKMEISLPPIVIYTGKDLSKEEETHLYKYSESIIIKGARSPERLLDEVNLFLHRVESMIPEDKRQMLSQLRLQDQNFEGKTVLLVDDDLRNVFALTNALEAKNLNVRIARDGVEALEQIEKHADIDLVLMDIMMPRMDGFEAMKRIRKSEDRRIRELPIVALTAKAMREDHEKCIAAGASDYIPKPVQLDHLTTILKVWLPAGGVFA